MKKIFSILFILVLVVSLGLMTAAPAAADVPGTTYYVDDDNCPGPGTGTQEDPFCSIQAAINATSAGDTIMVAAGEYEAFVVEGKSNISIIGVEGATVTTGDWVSINRGPIEDAWGLAAVKDSANIIIEGINFDGSGISEKEVVVGITYVDSTGRIADLTVANTIGTELGAGVTIIGDVGTSAVDLSCVTAQNSMAGVGIWNAEVDLNGCTVTETDAGIVIGWPLAGFDPSTVNIQGSTIADNDEAGIWVCDNSIVEAHFNNIVGNTDYGVRNDGGETVDAIYNWWGDATGPSGYGPGDGDAVSSNVNFEPWLGAGVVTKTVTNGTVDAKVEADTEVEVSGTATVTVSQYLDNPNPGGDAPTGFITLGKYVDVQVLNTTAATEIQIRLYYTDDEIGDIGQKYESYLRLLWWNGTAWVRCSDSGVNTASTGNYSGYMWAKIRANTTPSLAYLQGQEFGGYGGPSTPPSCFIATAAYGTDTAKELDILREFRDTVLLPNSLGARFVSLYYKTSPPIANFISQHEVLRTAVRVGFVDPIVKILNWTHDLWSA